MGLRVVGAGLGRTGTHSLKLALERLLGGPCYHMIEVFGRPDHVALWQRAIDGDGPWETMFEGYRAAVDWPAAAFWRELSRAYPDALVLLSVRDGEGWWRSADQTIFEVFRRDRDPAIDPWLTMVTDLFHKTFTEDFLDRDTAIAAFERHNETVRAEVPAGRLLEWRPGDGWEPICSALGLPVPDEPFPHVNSTEDFRAMIGFDR
jgi:hypothetical protein